MELFDVYPLYPVTPVSAKDIFVYDENGKAYLDFYGGHAVISIGHSHPHYIQRITEQLNKLTFYSNAVQNPLQQEYAEKLGILSGCEDYRLFLCNSGAEANENALKMASFATGRSKVIAFEKGFHGRTSAAVAVTDNESIKAPLNKYHQTVILPWEDLEALEKELAQGDVCAVIIESIQGVGGLQVASNAFLQSISSLCKRYGSMFIADEVQSGFGRSGAFFAFQHAGVTPDIIPIAKGMGNGFPIGGILLHPDIEARHGMLGTTFGGNHLACAAGLAVLEVIESEDLLSEVNKQSAFLKKQLSSLDQIKAVKGRGLMIGIELEFPVAALRKSLLLSQGVFTGGSSDKQLIRLLPPLTVKEKHSEQLTLALRKELSTVNSTTP
ncbi:aspartate aminotransferase family protein [Robertkochia aurantiaca]|uniref:aspartate aminotransferase family protein n=1 Tax=Robertkochia aurantiaca TaxID=2873700 RepID=UPI001CCD1345|nr:aminotransferase class III-fold pyridoxal phosphate-dependent enzyme [Robertkochia sp. 3YJGBD-33]